MGTKYEIIITEHKPGFCRIAQYTLLSTDWVGTTKLISKSYMVLCNGYSFQVL